LAAGYRHIVEDGLFLDDAEPCEVLLEHCCVNQEELLVFSGNEARSYLRVTIIKCYRQITY
jgi:hypothetical protein